MIIHRNARCGHFVENFSSFTRSKFDENYEPKCKEGCNLRKFLIKNAKTEEHITTGYKMRAHHTHQTRFHSHSNQQPDAANVFLKLKNLDSPIRFTNPTLCQQK